MGARMIFFKVGYGPMKVYKDGDVEYTIDDKDCDSDYRLAR